MQRGFQHNRAVTEMYGLDGVESKSISDDIRRFFNHKISKLSERHKDLSGWPPAEHKVDILCERAGGLFVYAVATINFLSTKASNPATKLKTLLKSPTSTAYEGRIATKHTSKSTLDSLYMHILQETFNQPDDTDDNNIRSILGVVVLSANPLPPSAIAELLGLETKEVLPILSAIQSLLVLCDENPDYPVRPFHKSFPDFITDQTRCTDGRFYVDVPDHRALLFEQCITLMERKLEDSGGVPDVASNSEVDKLQDGPSPALQYACKSWHEHLVGEHSASEIGPRLVEFMEKKFLFWLEVLSNLGAAREAVRALDTTKKWLKEVRSVFRPNGCPMLIQTRPTN